MFFLKRPSLLLFCAWMVACTAAEPERVLPVGSGTDTVDASIGDSGDGGGRVRPNPTTAPPELTGIVPSDAPVGGPEVVVSVEGSGFSKDSYVELDGVSLVTSYETPARLGATIPPSALKKAANLKVTVNTPASGSGGGRSNVISFGVLNPTPSLSALSPASAVAVTSTSGTPLSLTINGSGFSEAATINFGSLSLTPSIFGADSIRVNVPLTALVSAGSVPVTVTNPAPGGGASSSIAFTVTNPNVVLSKCTPQTIAVGSSSTVLTIEGTGFVSGSKVSFNGKDLTTTYATSTKLTASVPSSSLATTGAFPVSVTNPAPGGGVSAPLTVSVTNPSPTIATLSPATANVGAVATTLKVTGTGFVAGSRVRFDGTEATTTFASTTELKATLSAAQLSTAKTIAVSVSNPTPGGGISGNQLFVVSNPTPTITSMAPPSALVGAGDTVVVLNGSNFVYGAVVSADAVDLTTTYKSDKEISAKIPASKLATAGSISIRVRNPSPGGGSSSPSTFSVTVPTTLCTSTGVDYPLTTASSLTIPISYTFGPITPFMSAGAATSYTCPLDSLDATAEPQKFGYAIVQNATASPMYLSAEAVCTSVDDDAFMAFYRNSTTIPTNEAALKACTGFVSEGTKGGGARSSSMSSGSTYCPGLTVANGGAIKLASCETLVIVVQPYFYPDLPAPTSIKVTLAN